jgi:hypothetical protein
VRPQWLDSVVEAVTVDVVTIVEVAVDVELGPVDIMEVATDVEVDEDAGGLVTEDVRVSVDEAASVVVAVVSVDIIEDAEDDASVVPVRELVVASTVCDSVDMIEDVASVVSAEDVAVLGTDEVDGVNVVVGKVRVELSSGWNLRELAVTMFDVTPTIARKRISANIICVKIDFTRGSPLISKSHKPSPFQLPYNHLGAMLTTDRS